MPQNVTANKVKLRPPFALSPHKINYPWFSTHQILVEFLHINTYLEPKQKKYTTLKQWLIYQSHST